MIPALLSGLLGRLLGGGAAKAAGIFSSATLVGSVAAGTLWLLGPGREWQITLNALELCGVGLGAAALLEWFRRIPPGGRL